MTPKIVPTIMIILSVIAAIVYATKLDIRHTVYWLAAAALNIAVTF